jgi:hypothetical protein
MTCDDGGQYVPMSTFLRAAIVLLLSCLPRARCNPVFIGQLKTCRFHGPMLLVGRLHRRRRLSWTEMTVGGTGRPGNRSSAFSPRLEMGRNPVRVLVKNGV